MSGAREPSTGGSSFLTGGGEMGTLIRTKDWSRTPLGDPETWPRSLKTAVSILLNSRHPMFVFWGPRLVKIYNDAYSPIPGDKHPWALGQSARQVWPEIWDTIGPMVMRVMEHGEATWSEDLMLFLNRHGYQEETYFTFSYSPIRDESGSIGGLLCVCSETTARVLGERRLRTLRHLAAAGARGRSEVEVYHLVSEVLGANATDIPFALLYRVNHDASAARLVEAVGTAPDAPVAAALIESGQPAAWPLFEIAGDGELGVTENLGDRFSALPAGPWNKPPSSAAVIPLIDRGQQQPFAFLVLGINVCRAFDDAYRGFFELVRAQIAASIANAGAAEEERKRARTLAKLDRAKTAFFANISHEFRTPLTLMLGPLEDVLAAPPGQEGEHRDGLRLARRSSQRLLRLVNMLLDFSKVEADRVDASFQAVDLSAATRELASHFCSACERADLQLTVECPPLPAAVWVDRNMWEQIVINLLSNALKFTLEGGIAVTLRPLEDAVVLEVRDTGTGIPEHELPHIFERFHRVAGTRGRTQEGSGIGLALVRDLVQLHGGEIRAIANTAGGTTFVVTIPWGSSHLPAEQINLAASESDPRSEAERWVRDDFDWLFESGDDPKLAIANGESGPAMDQGTRRPRLLLAEDNADMRAYLRRLLAAEWEVEAVVDGAAALTAALRHPPDMVLSDLIMPELDGLALVRALRAEPATRELPIVLLSARAGDEARISALNAGAVDYLAKPFTARELSARLRSNLELARTRDEANRAFRLSADRLAKVLEGVPALAGLLEPDGTLIEASSRILKPAGLQPTDVIGKKLWDCFWWNYDDIVQNDLKQAVARAASGELVRYDVEVRVGEDRMATIDFQLSPLRDQSGHITHLVPSAIDITERKRSEHVQRLLIDELNHRVRNTLTVVKSIAAQTRRHSASLESFGTAFDGRIQALATTHTLLAESRWSASTLHALIEQQVRPYIKDSKTLMANGPRLEIRPKSALALGLIFHELATNAFKYGALSGSAGSVDVLWEVIPQELGRTLKLRWLESGGPAVQSPEDEGFGTKLIDFNVLHEFNGQVERDYQAPGLACILTIPISRAIGPL